MTVGKERDLGTPARTSDKTVSLEIDRHAITVPEGTSLMRAAEGAGIAIPRLCSTDRLEPFGSCRLCLVEIEGRKGTPSSCTTSVAQGMKVRTQTEKLSRLRRGVMELYVSDHPLDCDACAADGDCELQDMAEVVGLSQRGLNQRDKASRGQASGDEVRYGFDGAYHPGTEVDASNPYFQYDPTKCIVCSRCVRACEEVQGTFALTIGARGFASRVTAGMQEAFMESECVSCGACVQVCPTATLMERLVVERGQPNRVVETTCAYCGVGCSFRAELQGDEVVRMVPSKAGGANEGHSCVKGRFAWGYTTHKDRITRPMIRTRITEPWREVSWDEAIAFAGERLKAIQAKHGRGSIGGVTSSRCTNEEVWVVQKMIRAAFGNNNVDNCARVCHAPTGYGLKQTFGTSAGTQDFRSVEKADVVLVIGANPTDAHPVFASRLKRRLREGAKLIVADPRRIDLVKSPHISAAHHLQLRPGTNVAVINALAHVIVTEGLAQDDFVSKRCEAESYVRWKAFISDASNSPEALEEVSGVSAEDIRAAARAFAGAGNAAIYYGLGVTEHSQGSTMVMGLANLAMATGNIGREGVGINPLRGQNNVQGSCDMGSFPHELPGYRHVSDDAVRASFEADWAASLDPEPGLRAPNMFAAALEGSFKAMFIQGEDFAQSDPNTQHVTAALEAMDCVIVQDLFLNETSAYAHVFLPGATFLEKNGTFTNAERRINRVRPVVAEAGGLSEWETVCRLASAMGYPMHYENASQIMDEIARLTPAFQGVSFSKLDREGSLQWPCNEAQPDGTPIMHVGNFVRGKGQFMLTQYVPTDEKSNRTFPLLLTTGRILTQYNVGTQTRRTANSEWHDEDVLEIHPHDADVRGVTSGDLVSLTSRKGDIALHALITDRVPQGVVYTTFHHALTGSNVVTTELSDWATSCPEYKVTAVQVVLTNHRSEWQEKHDAHA